MSAKGESPSTTEIERAIGQTRAELALTVSAIEHKFNARHLMKEGLDMFNDTFAGGEAINRGIDIVRANPVPIALIGIGAVWLIAANAKGEQAEVLRRRIAETARDTGARAGMLVSGVAQRAGIAAAATPEAPPLGHTGNPVVDQPAHDRPSGWVHQMNDAAQDALRSVRDTSAAAIDRAGIYAGDGAKRMTERLIDAAQRHPLLLGAVGVMAGALVASLLPLSRTEEQWIGGTRDAFWQRAGDAGQQTVGRIRDAASHAASQAADAAAIAAGESLKESIAGAGPQA